MRLRCRSTATINLRCISSPGLDCKYELLRSEVPVPWLVTLLFEAGAEAQQRPGLGCCVEDGFGRAQGAEDLLVEHQIDLPCLVGDIEIQPWPWPRCQGVRHQRAPSHSKISMPLHPALLRFLCQVPWHQALGTAAPSDSQQNAKACDFGHDRASGHERAGVGAQDEAAEAGERSPDRDMRKTEDIFSPPESPEPSQRAFGTFSAHRSLGLGCNRLVT